MTNRYKTPLEALETSRRIWRLIADGTANSKIIAYKILKLPIDTLNCPCCEYADQGSNSCAIDCTICPLFGEYREPVACEANDTPWKRYLEAVGDSKPAAREMLDLINEKIAQIKKA